MALSFAFFPGQGAQAPGMGRSLFEGSAAARRVFECAGDTCGMDVAALCFDSTPEVLSRTENSQIAIFTHSLAALAALRERDASFAACAGFSLGEYTALAAAGVLTLEDGLKLVRRRGQLMQHAADTQDGGMAAILGLEDTAVEQVCSGASCTVLPVNYNCPGQLVIAGERRGLEEAVACCKAAGARRAIPLAVSGAFHTPLMREAAAELRKFAEGFTFHKSSMPIYTNVTGQILDTTDYPAHLERHMISPVRWKALVKNCLDAGMTRSCEIGPGRTLTGFARKISKELDAIAIGTMENVQSFPL